MGEAPGRDLPTSEKRPNRLKGAISYRDRDPNAIANPVR